MLLLVQKSCFTLGAKVSSCLSYLYASAGSKQRCDVLQGRFNALKTFQYLEGLGLVQKATSPPDLSHQCNPFQVRSLKASRRVLPLAYLTGCE